MKKSILFILFALVSVVGFSQITGWNAKVGMNISNYTGDADMNAKLALSLEEVLNMLLIILGHCNHHCL